MVQSRKSSIGSDITLIATAIWCSVAIADTSSPNEQIPNQQILGELVVLDKRLQAKREQLNIQQDLQKDIENLHLLIEKEKLQRELEAAQAEPVSADTQIDASTNIDAAIDASLDSELYDSGSGGIPLSLDIEKVAAVYTDNPSNSSNFGNFGNSGNFRQPYTTWLMLADGSLESVSRGSVFSSNGTSYLVLRISDTHVYLESEDGERLQQAL